MKVRKGARAVRSLGVGGAFLTVLDRLRHRRAVIAEAVHAAVQDGRVLEIGGPSSIFSPDGMLPLYSYALEVDNVNFASNTLWGSLMAGGEAPPAVAESGGRFFVAEATALTGIADGSYDVVASSHALEHVANPLRALREWKRVSRPGGFLVLVLPHKEGTFDCRRPVTTLSHLLDDESRDAAESDSTHFDEILSLHHVGRDIALESKEALSLRLERNVSLRSAHHHVFDLHLASKAVEVCGWTVLGVEARRPFHILLLAQNGVGEGGKGSHVMGGSAFRWDRVKQAGKENDVGASSG